ncbi:MAG: hypothetical protein A2987_01620 [Omnitrophica bacterium RIFCSPLOWO2_01_FULL_45_10]|nr:MAG: hypothetical protein A2987_01620 [Omnitrophica bacterium RIFCSPLOWO2_01_FULL_45_10]
MSKYSVEITTSAQRQFKKLSSGIQDRILPKLFSLETHPRPFGSQKLRDSNFYRVRVGDYRIIYSVDDSRRIIKILDVAHRREVYR